MATQAILRLTIGVTTLILATGVLVMRLVAEDGDEKSGTACSTVFHAQSQGDDPIGELCTALENTGARVDRVRVTLTAARAACDDAVSLQVSAAGKNGDISQTSKVGCVGDRAEAAFDIGLNFEADTEICGSLPDDAPYNRFRPARACVRMP